MKCLEMKESEMYTALGKGHFTVQKISSVLSNMGIDQAHEQKTRY